MSANIQTNKTFEQKVFDRMRDSIGDLITDEDLKRILEATMQRVFFEPRKVPSANSWDRDKVLEPEVNEIVRKLLTDRMTALLKDWIEANPTEIERILKEVIAAGVVGALRSHLESMSSVIFHSAINEIATKLKHGS